MGRLEISTSQKEYTGGIDSKTGRAYTQASDGSDKALLSVKNTLPAVGLSSDVEEIEFNTKSNPGTLKIKSQGSGVELVFSGNLPTKENPIESWSSSTGNDKLSIHCAVNCNTLVAKVISENSQSSFVVRNTLAKAKILHLHPSEAFKIAKNFPQTQEFIDQFLQNSNASAQNFEIVNGKSTARVTLSWGSANQLCLEIPLTTTDIGPAPLSEVKITCGASALPALNISLVGNNQSGKLALRFVLSGGFAFVLYLDLNGQEISDLAPLDTSSTDLVMAKIKSSNAVFKTNLNGLRSLLTTQQLYRDIPSSSASSAQMIANTPTEQIYGEKVTQSWIEKWQGGNHNASTCFDKKGNDYQFRKNFSQYIKSAPNFFRKVEDKFIAKDVPSFFMFMTLIESPRFFRSSPIVEISSAGAVGPWQIIDETAKRLGLTVFPLVNGNADPRDQRAQWETATSGALKYLAQILRQVGDADYKLALAAYNQGPDGLFNYIKLTTSVENYDKFYIKKSKKEENLPPKPINYSTRITENNLPTPDATDDWTDLAKKWKYSIPNYWFLHEFHMMPCETRDYVPKIVSAMIIGENPKAYGF